VNGANVRMIQRRGSLRFPLKSRECPGIFRQFGREKLQRDEAMEARVLGFIDNTHAPAAEFLDDAVVRNGFSLHFGIWKQRP